MSVSKPGKGNNLFLWVGIHKITYKLLAAIFVNSFVITNFAGRFVLIENNLWAIFTKISAISPNIEVY
jgi:hypothetical protein